MTYDTVIDGKYKGLALVFPPEWENEKIAALLWALDADVVVSNEYIVTDANEIARFVSEAQRLRRDDPADVQRLIHFRNGSVH